MRTITILALVAAAGAPALAASPDSVARVLSVRGSAMLSNDETGTEFGLSRGARIYANDTIQTYADSAVRVMLTDRSVIDIGSNSKLKLDSITKSEKKAQVTLRLVVGRLWSRVSKLFSGDKRYVVETETAVAGVRGTEFIIEFDPDGTTTVQVIDGTVQMANLTGDLAEMLGPMMAGVLGSGGSIKVSTITPRDLTDEVADTQPSGQLSAGELAELGGASDDATPDQPPLQLGLGSPVPSLETEPGLGSGTLSGTVDVRIQGADQ